MRTCWPRSTAPSALGLKGLYYSQDFLGTATRATSTTRRSRRSGKDRRAQVPVFVELSVDAELRPAGYIGNLVALDRLHAALPGASPSCW